MRWLAVAVLLLLLAVAPGCQALFGGTTAEEAAPEVTTLVFAAVTLEDAKAFTLANVEVPGTAQPPTCQGDFPLDEGQSAECRIPYRDTNGADCSQTLEVTVMDGGLVATDGAGECRMEAEPTETTG